MNKTAPDTSREPLSKEQMAEANECLSRAKVLMMMRADAVFFTTVCFSMKHEWSYDFSTAATNGLVVYYNPHFFMSLNRNEQVGLMLHETLHAAYMHPDRLGDQRDPRRWNVAADYVINDQIVSRGYQLPDGALLDSSFRNMSAEQVYPLIPKPPEDYQPDVIEAPPEDDKNSRGETMDDILVRAKMEAEIAGAPPGSIPGDLARYIDKLTNPKMPWDHILRKFMNRMAKTEWSFRRPNRRYMDGDIVFPSMYSEAMGHFAVVIDTSGSISKEQFEQFITETHSILKNQRPSSITVIQFDHGIEAIDEVYNERELMQIEFKGGGGTCTREVIEWAEKHKPQALVMFTDGYFDYIKPPKAVPFIWIIHTNDSFTVPAGDGKVIPYKLD